MKPSLSMFLVCSKSPRLMPLGVVLSILSASLASAKQNGAPTPAPQSSAFLNTPQSSASNWEVQPLTFTAAKQPLTSIVDTLSRRLGRAIVVDGEPSLCAADFDLHGNAKEVLGAVAEKFDYSWKVDKNGVVLLNKRFTSEDDVPQVHLAEMTQMTSDFERLLPDTGIALDQIILPLNALYRTFTPEQLTLLQDKKRIEFTQLPSEQRKLVHLAIVNNMLSDGHLRWEYLHELLAALPRARVVQRPCITTTIVKRASLPPSLSTEQPGNVVVDAKGHIRDDMAVRTEPGEELVCLWQDGQGREQTLELFRQAKQDQSEQEASVTRERNAGVGKPAEQRGQIRPALPTLASADVGLNAPVHLRLGSTTLEYLASTIEEQTGIHILVPRWLRERQIIAQMDNLSVRMALDALAELDGWRVTVFSDKAAGIGRPTVANIEQLSELPTALNGVMPADLRRFLRVPATLPQGSQAHSTIYRNPVTGDKILDTSKERLLACDKLGRAALRRGQSLWVSQPMKGVPSKTLAYIKLSPMQRNLLAEIVAFKGLSQILSLPTVGNNLLYGTIYVHEQDETKSFLSMRGSDLLVSTETMDSNFHTIHGFGEPIQSPTTLPDPLHFGFPRK